jgi:dTDP-4-amino-4,6-dideoxygalactose transaminase
LNVKIPANKPYFPEQQRSEIAAEITRILEGGILTQGPWVRKLEQLFAGYVGAKFAIATNSGTSALEILLRYFDVKDQEVILPTNTFLATGNAVIFAGGMPVLADISADTLCIDPDEIQRKITPQTKGVVVVHIGGLISPQIDEIRDLCAKRELFLIEDAAHAPGAAIAGKHAGNLGDGGAFSFYPTKPLTSGEGGMITTNDTKCDQFARSVRSHGINTDPENVLDKSLLVRLGYNWRMSELQAVVAWYQLKNLNEAISRRNQVAEIYRRELKDIPGVRLFETPEEVTHSYYKFPVLIDKQLPREQISGRFRNDFGIQVGSIYWPPCHLQPFYKEHFGYRVGDFPVAEDVLQRTFALPIYPEMSEQDVLAVREALHKIAEEEIVIYS